MSMSLRPRLPNWRRTSRCGERLAPPRPSVRANSPGPRPERGSTISSAQSAIGADMPRVSLLMPVFNTPPYLPQALASVRDQHFEDFEVVVVNDGSTDGSSEILRAFADDEPRMRLIERDNRGLIETRNQLLHEAQGELIA